MKQLFQKTISQQYYMEVTLTLHQIYNYIDTALKDNNSGIREILQEKGRYEIQLKDILGNDFPNSKDEIYRLYKSLNNQQDKEDLQLLPWLHKYNFKKCY